MKHLVAEWGKATILHGWRIKFATCREFSPHRPVEPESAMHALAGAGQRMLALPAQTAQCGLAAVLVHFRRGGFLFGIHRNC
ncbi:MAG: hypothetical protein R3F38_02180 [Gammaproteobacteria bacterium]